MTDYVVVTGGVTSSLGKGVVAASIGAILKSRHLKVSMLKLSPYINSGSARISPVQHGEVYVTADGAEGDVDLGHYERFASVGTGRCNNVTTGQIYTRVIARERRGDYLGSTVQVVPHITDEIKLCVREAADDADICIVEIGGTVGDIELLPFIEAVRQMRAEGPGKVVFVHLTLVPTVADGQETKTKPTQHSVRELRVIGVQPDVLVCRSRAYLTPEQQRKISLFTNVEEQCVISVPELDDLYQMPLTLHGQSMDEIILSRLGVAAPAADINDWKRLSELRRRADSEVEIALIGAYAGSRDSYASLHEALIHAGIRNETRVQVNWLEPRALEDADRCLGNMDGILIAGGAGEGDISETMDAVRYAREAGVPYLGICLGMHVAIIEYARNVLGLPDANSTEFDPRSRHPVLTATELDEAVDGHGRISRWRSDDGCVTRLGSEEVRLATGTLVHKLYGREIVAERHRNRFEFNNHYLEQYRQGMVFAAFSHDGFVEVIEVPRHRWFVATQFRPEFNSTPHTAHPLFNGFIGAAREFHGERVKSKEAA